MVWFWVVFHSSPFVVFWVHIEPSTFVSVASHSFVIVAFEAFVIFLLVNTTVPFHEPWSFHFLLVFKLFPIGYGPTPSKRKDIVLEQEVVSVLSLYCIEKRRESFWDKVLSLQSEWEFISKWWHTRSLQLFQVSGRCGRNFFKVL
jgi:hypothetical protein